jgi:hypothetical protein
MNRAPLILVLAVTFCSGLVQADERLLLDKTTILGNRELPKVTFVVPWRDVPSDIPGWQPSPLAHPFAMPLDVELYHRQLDYSRQLKNQRDGKTPR